jgi:hypothetical protein
MLGIGRQGEQGLGGSLEQEIVDHRLVVPGEIADRGRQREHHVEVGQGQQLGLAICEPVPRRRALAFGAVPVAAGVVGDADVATLLAALDMPAEGCRAAGLDGAHHLELAEADVAGMGGAPGSPMSAEDIRHLDDRAGSSPCG